MKILKQCRRLLLASATALACVAPIGEAMAADYPAKPVTAIVPFGAGGGTDTYARTLASVAYDIIGQPVVVVNRPGGGGYVGAKFAADARNDGHTIMVQSAGSFILGGMMQRRPVDPFKDFDAVAVIGQLHTGLVVPKDSPFQNVGDLIAAAKKSKLTWAHTGRGGVHHMAGAAFSGTHGFSATDVPFKGGGNVRTAIIGGQVDFGWMGVQQVAGFEDKLRVLGVANTDRDPVQNSYETFKELGVDYVRFVSPITVYVPKGTSPAIIEKLAVAIKDMQQQKPFKKLAKSSGLAIMYKGPKEASEYLNALKAEWQPVVDQVKTELSKK